MAPTGAAGSGDGYHYRRRARSPRTAAAVALLWLALFAAWLWLDAALPVLGFLALFSLPALWDLWRNPASGLSLAENALSWHSANRRATLPLAKIDHIRFDTALDLSARVTAVLRSGRKIRLPYEATPPHRAFEAALQARAIPTERHHFTLFQ
ncbi:hypothetical protein ACFSUD_03120 [Sulfitobacter aestuarii]|uniref:PH domain-containing protein n=1 Tax=Sulfitobacter aestuarii TaxID=2161676 RepID=A0ABW5U187_9RHOB